MIWTVTEAGNVGGELSGRVKCCKATKTVSYFSSLFRKQSTTDAELLLLQNLFCCVLLYYLELRQMIGKIQKFLAVYLPEHLCYCDLLHNVNSFLGHFLLRCKDLVPCGGCRVCCGLFREKIATI